jgi:hypothetical protein
MMEFALVFRRRDKTDVAVAKTISGIEEIFVVPVCSMFSTTRSAYIAFLDKVGALARAEAIVASANLKQPRVAEMTRRTVRALVTEAEVQAFAPGIDSLSLSGSADLPLQRSEPCD